MTKSQPFKATEFTGKPSEHPANKSGKVKPSERSPIPPNYFLYDIKIGSSTTREPKLLTSFFARSDKEATKIAYNKGAKPGNCLYRIGQFDFSNKIFVARL